MKRCIFCVDAARCCSIYPSNINEVDTKLRLPEGMPAIILNPAVDGAIFA